MKTTGEELLLFQRMGISTHKSRQGRSPADALPKHKRLAEPPPARKLPRYASAFWLSDHEAESGTLRLTIGWAMQLDGTQLHESGAWTLRSHVPSKPARLKNILSPVEETHGVVFRKPTEHEEEINTHADRLLADWLLFLMHRMLFNQCQKLDDRIPEGVAEVFLLYGPVLPKFVGRVCYSNFTRDKTVAIVAPGVRVGEQPEQSCRSWKDEPYPSFGHDHAERRWTTTSGNSHPESPLRIGSFTIIEPTGDGFSGKIVGGPALGPTKWLQKSHHVREIIDRDSVEVKMALWQHRSIRVPRGLAFAARTAVLQHDLDYCTRQTDRIKVEFNPESKALFGDYEQRARREVPGVVKRGELSQNALLARARWKYAELLRGQEERGRPITNRQKEVPLHQVRLEMEKSLGESVFKDFS